ncbi:Cys-tRNA(Pro) deacylase [Larsenimonas rhizosphaerae]|uniref:Cys-tRNA(Pro) deacylase n=1 Tax=Larsenimonas rhizosphaerae TaxID=2944682 RepID=UPI002033E20B|nr:Cys-tRNA(Pro) deacylase [Larsenimonas rhizosphaerae]MCM2131603.1 Cys-tRNA(Pro) deacylase [Larsenimonas rhizosphaerae]
MTPAIRLLKQQGIPFETLRFEHAEGAHSFGDEAAQALDYPAAQIFKTLMVTLDQRKLVVAIVPVAGTLDLKALARAAGARKAAMAERVSAEQATGYIIGGISPLGQKKSHPTFIDASARQWDAILVSGGRRGLDISLAPEDLARLVKAQFVAIARID